MEESFSISEAKNKLTALIHRVEKGAPVKLTRHGRPVAVLVSTREYEKLRRKGRGFWRDLTSFRIQMEKEGVIITEDDLSGLRDRAPGRAVDLNGTGR